MPKDVRGIMEEFKSGELHSGSKSGPVVTNRKQAIAIALSEKRKQQGQSSLPRPPRQESTPGLMATRNNLRGIRSASIAHIRRGSR